MSKSKVLFQMTGSIACFKACQAISKLVQAGFDVQVVASTAALKFVGEATLEGLTGRPVISDLFQQGEMMGHIHWIRWADVILVAPATANYINRIAQGIGDDLLTTQFLAHDFKKPFLVAPAMNTMMYLHPITQKSLKTLKELGVEILETASGVLACGEVGWGRLLEPDLIVQEVQRSLRSPSPTQTATPSKKTEAQKILITSGGTQEPIDEVRVLSNRSTGTTGAALADLCTEMGFDVTYVHAENAVQPKNQMEKFSFQSFSDLDQVLRKQLRSDSYKAVIHTAAVSDYSILSIETPQGSQPASGQGKISSETEVSLKLKKNPKLINQLREFANNPELKVIGFKMTATASEELQKSAIRKIFDSAKANLIVHNDMSEMSWGDRKHTYHIYENAQSQPTTVQNREELGSEIMRWFMRSAL